MRDIIELWLIVEANFERIYDGLKYKQGLCNVLHVLFEEDKISYDEKLSLKMQIYKYQKARGRGLEVYAWIDPLARKPRRMFIHKQILKELRK